MQPMVAIRCHQSKAIFMSKKKSQKKQSSTFVNVIFGHENYNSLQIVTALNFLNLHQKSKKIL